MSRKSGQKVFRKSLKITRKYHDEIVDKIDENPAILNEIPGLEDLNSGIVLYKLKNPELLSERTKGHTIDNLFLYKLDNYYEILLVEVKIGLHQIEKGIYQLERARNHFRKHWREWFDQDLIKEKLDLSTEGKVWLSTLLLLCNQPLMDIKESVVSKERMKLGKITKKVEK